MSELASCQRGASNMFFHYEPKNPSPFHPLQIFNFPYKSNQLHHKTFIFTSGNFPKKRREGDFGWMISGIC